MKWRVIIPFKKEAFEANVDEPSKIQARAEAFRLARMQGWHGKPVKEPLFFKGE